MPGLETWTFSHRRLGTMKGCGHSFFIYFIEKPVHLNVEVSESAFVSSQPGGQSETNSGKLAKKCLFKRCVSKSSPIPFPQRDSMSLKIDSLKIRMGEGTGPVSGRGREKFSLA